VKMVNEAAANIPNWSS